RDVAAARARLASGWLVGLCREGVEPSGSRRKVSERSHVVLRSRAYPVASWDQVESRYDPKAVGSLGEVGLMQIRPRTAALLGYKGEAIGLAEPETNVRLGVAYLARAWQLANGDVCRALMKYRGGWGEERMTLLSAEYCRRARSHLAAIGSPLADA